MNNNTNIIKGIMALGCGTEKQISLIPKFSTKITSNKQSNHFVLFNIFSLNALKYPFQSKEELLFNKKQNKHNHHHNTSSSHSSNNRVLSTSSLTQKSSSMAKTLSIKFPIALTPYQHYEKLREDSFKQLKMKLEFSRPFNTQNDINQSKNSTLMTKEKKRKQNNGQISQWNYSNRRVSQEEVNRIADILSKKYNVKKENEEIKKTRKPLMLKYKPKQTNKAHQILKILLSPLHKIKLSYCKSYEQLHQSPVDCFSI